MTAVTTTVEPLRAADTRVGRSRVNRSCDVSGFRRGAWCQHDLADAAPRGDEGEDLRTDLELLTGRRHHPLSSDRALSLGGTRAHRIDQPGETVAAQAHLPLHPACGRPENIAELGPLS